MGKRGWYIVQTNPNCEAKAAGEIRRAGFRAYVPSASGIKFHHRTKLPIVKRRPALVGYLFVRFPDDAPNWYALRQCQGVKGVLYSDGVPYMLPQRQLAAIMRAQREAKFDTQEARAYRLSRRAGERQSIMRSMASAKFKPGTVVRANGGAAEHIIARVESVTKTGTIKAIATLFGQEIQIEYSDAADLEIVHDALADGREAA